MSMSKMVLRLLERHWRWRNLDEVDILSFNSSKIITHILDTILQYNYMSPYTFNACYFQKCLWTLQGAVDKN